MNRELQNIGRMASALRENLAKCGRDADVDAVHDTRTGTRRLQATLENLVRETREGDDGTAVREAATHLMRQLKKIRRAAGPARDLDVHRKLVEKLLARTVQPEGDQEGHSGSARERDVLETTGAGLRSAGLEKQADALDTWLKHRRAEDAAQLQELAPGLSARLDKRLDALEEALSTVRRSRKPKPPAVLALENFARLATEMQLLDAGNLHDFRKGAKKARYVADLAGRGDSYTAQIARALKKLQDEIGEWHDWLVLAEEGHSALGDEATELIGLLKAEREKHFVHAMETAAKLRGRLMGEWLATARKPVRRAANGPAAKRPLRAAQQAGRIRR